MAKKQALTKELLDRLSEDGYCFDRGHDAEIARLRAEIDAYRQKEETAKAEIAKAVEAAVAPLHQKIKEQSDRIYDLEEKLKKVQDESETWRRMWEDNEKKIVTIRDEIEKSFLKEERCFNIGHTLLRL
jgi:predicted  nucleic acid-binding Zn-ribbon protein